jgi:hypothetical protein
MTPCKSCATPTTTHKPWCMRPAAIQYQPRTIHEARAQFLRMCA